MPLLWVSAAHHKGYVGVPKGLCRVTDHGAGTGDGSGVNCSRRDSLLSAKHQPVRACLRGYCHRMNAKLLIEVQHFVRCEGVDDEDLAGHAAGGHAGWRRAQWLLDRRIAAAATSLTSTDHTEKGMSSSAEARESSRSCRRELIPLSERLSGSTLALRLRWQQASTGPARCSVKTSVQEPAARPVCCLTVTRMALVSGRVP
jgi:hypothetical protein